MVPRVDAVNHEVAVFFLNLMVHLGVRGASTDTRFASVVHAREQRRLSEIGGIEASSIWQSCSWTNGLVVEPSGRPGRLNQSDAYKDSRDFEMP
jgi:hypothetical protein